MSTTLTIRDETTFDFGGDKDEGFALDVSAERVTVRGLLRGRVDRELRGHNVR